MAAKGTTNVKPDLIYRAGHFEVAVWSTKAESEDGKEYLKHGLSLTKSWKDKDGSWQKARLPLFPDDLPEIVSLLQVVWARLAVKTEKR